MNDMAKKPTPQVRISDSALEYLEKIKTTIGVDNNTRVVNSSLQLASEVFDVLASGGKVKFEKRNGEIENVRLLVS